MPCRRTSDSSIVSPGPDSFLSRVFARWFAERRTLGTKIVRPRQLRAGLSGILEKLEDRALLAGLNIVYDYTYDTNNFFDTVEKKAVLEEVAEYFESRFINDIAAIQPAGINSWTPSFTNPSTGAMVSLPNLAIPANTVIVYVGARNLSGPLGTAGRFSYSASGFQDWFRLINSRDETPGAPETDFLPTGGVLTFDLSATWHMSTSIVGLENGENDLLTVAYHEMGHLLGFSDNIPAFAALINDDGYFTGTNSVAAYDGVGPVPLYATDLAHWASNLTDDGQPTVMQPVLLQGTRRTMTELDLAAFLDIGWVMAEANVAPAALGLDPASIEEGSPLETVIGTFNTTDANAGDTFTYTLVSGDGDDDNSAFLIQDDQLLTNTVLDFDVKSSYTVRVLTTDAGGLSFEQSFTITVSAVNFSPTDITLTNAHVNENQPAGTVVGTLGGVDPNLSDTLTLSLVTGGGDTGNSSFTIVGNQLQTTAAFNFELQASYSIRVRVADAGGLTYEEIFSVSITDVNEAPTAVYLSNDTIQEQLAAGTVVGILSSADQDGGDFWDYTLVSGVGDSGNASFQIVGNQIRTAETLDYNSQASYSIRVRTTDAGGLNFEQSFTITVTEVNFAPTDILLAGNSLDENQFVGTTVGTLSGVDSNLSDTLTFTLASGMGDSGNSSFMIVGNQLWSLETFNFESQASYSVRVRVTDAGGLNYEKSFSITVNDINDAPSEIALAGNSIEENQPAATVVGMLSGEDQDAGDSLTFSLVAGVGDTGNAFFEIVGSQLRSTTPLDFETQTDYSIRVRATDGDGATLDQVFSISVLNSNELPTVQLAGSTLNARRNKLTLIDPAANLVDDSSDFANGELVVTITAGAQAGDLLGVKAGRTSAGKIKLKQGTQLVSGKTVLATVTSQGGATPSLRFDFQSGVTNTLVEELLRQLTFKGKLAGSRTLEIVATDPPGLESVPVTRTVQVS